MFNKPYPTNIINGTITADLTTRTKKLNITGISYMAYNHVGVNTNVTITSTSNTDNVQKATGTLLIRCASCASLTNTIKLLINTTITIETDHLIVVVISIMLFSTMS